MQVNGWLAEVHTDRMVRPMERLHAVLDDPIASFANGVVKDEAAVRAAITLYGRGKIDLLRTRPVGAE
ncbi:hypothetical protein AC629_15085 [Bradyrhizobium sp. NAS80.1]|nr:hypothetical protein AC629_15085 [Bradyrhizobium sp. NAS80.1]